MRTTHEDYSRERPVEGSTNRSFGLVMAAACGVFAVSPKLHGHDLRTWLLVPGAFFLVDASSTEEAQVIASKHAAANYGEHIGFAVEVRPCELFESGELAAPVPKQVAETAGLTVR